MKCTLRECPGQYEQRNVIHTVRKNGQIIVIDHVPAEVCDVCGDVLLTPETVRHIEALLNNRPSPCQVVPAYEYA